MKAKLTFALTVFALTLAFTDLRPISSTQSATTPQQCSAFCSRVRCIGGYVCGLYTNSSGQTVCGCHPR